MIESFVEEDGEFGGRRGQSQYLRSSIGDDEQDAKIFEEWQAQD